MYGASYIVKWGAGMGKVRWSSRNISQFLAHPSANFERPTPVVLIGGEGCDHKLWSKLSEFLSYRGYGGVVLEYPAQGASFEEMANILHKEVVQQRFTPPVLVAHSLSTFVAQKYLESYALSGLILVNPIPPSAGPAIAALNSKWQRSLQTSHRDLAGCDVSDQRRDTLLCYYGLRGPVSRSGRTAEDTVIEYSNDVATSTSQPFFTTDCAFNALLAEESTEDTTVNLERGAVPTLVVTSDGDRSVFSAPELEALLRLHAVTEEEVVHFSSPTDALGGDARAPMVTHRDEFNDVVFNWIEAVT